MQVGFEEVKAAIGMVPPVRRCGRVTAIERGLVRVAGLPDDIATGDLIEIGTGPGRRLGEVLELASGGVLAAPDGAAEGLRLGMPASRSGCDTLAPHDSWLGRLIDPVGRPLDGRPLLPGRVARSVRAAPPPPVARRAMGARLDTGLAIFDTLLPIVRGQRIGLFAGSGVGKSTLLARFVAGIEADVLVLALVGERGREVGDFVSRVLGPEGMRRTVVVAATSDRSPMMRRRCALSAMTVAEHFRDAGRNVVLLADSLTRFAEAHREIALSSGEPPSLRGFPPSTAQALMGLCERAGPGTDAGGDITAIFTVLVAGSDMDEPVADIVRGTLDGHVVLDREIAERGRFPAVDLLRSVSRSLPGAAGPEENGLIALARRRIADYEKVAIMLRAGLYAPGADPGTDAAIAVWPSLDRFLAEESPRGSADSFERLGAILGAA
ncbi:MAG: FliI/YscN family ATPase [Rhodobacteraceae bacterium]|jgi:flagellum-specific ATP synthase|nr:FliI/YscN family ATPase [Paracoccaceae bacterium]